MKVIINNSKLVFASRKIAELGEIIQWNTSTAKINFFTEQSKFTELGLKSGKDAYFTLYSKTESVNTAMVGKSVKLGFYNASLSAVVEKDVVWGETATFVVPDFSGWTRFYINADVEGIGTKQFFIKVSQ